ncbi:MAG TPA: VOC family protein [Gammaproteobacteria bacterium]|nr:VOC family protein [Gammaproteobacteria bacterium]
MKRPPATGGLRHVALNVTDMAACERFYVDLLGLEVEWRPDPDNLYLTSGCDNIALHRAQDIANIGQRLDHIGFILRTADDVDVWFEFLIANDVPVVQPPRTHRDGARSFYCSDPQGNLVQMIHHPPIARKCP